MSSHADIALDFADAVAEGRSIDWASAEDSRGPDVGGLIREFALLAAIASVRDTVAGHDERVAPPSSWGRFESLVEVGAGAYGHVYRAWDPALERHVAVKLLHADADGSDAVLREARLIARVRHPHVVTIHGVDRVDGQVGLWMEYVDGRTLKQEVLERGVLPPRGAALIGLDLCRGLSAVHAAGLLHRDIKAQNVMRDGSGRVVLMDFGAGDHRDQTAAADRLPERGTPFYMAPELFTGAASSVRSDVYSLGVLLFYLLTGTFPVDGTTLDEVKEGHGAGRRRRVADLRPDVPPTLATVIDRATDGDTSRRYGTAAELAQALEGVLPSLTTAARATRTTQRWVMAALVALAVAGVAGWRLRAHDADAPAPVVRSIAVLPFTNLSASTADDYLAEGMTELITADLSQHSALRVSSRTSLARFRHSNDGLPAIGKALGVDAIVEGSVMRVADQIRVTARVISVAADQSLWTRSYERKTTDLFSLQGEISSAIAGAINISVTPGEPRSAPAPRLVDPEAQEAYLRGQFLLNQFTADSTQAALGHFQTAVAKAPAYGRARAALARCYILLEFFGLMPLPQAYDAAFQEASRAVEVEPDNAEAHGELADVLLYRRDWQGAGREYERAVSLNHSNTLSRSHYARYLSALERHDEAIIEARAAADLDPFSTEALGAVPLALYYARRYSEAVDGWASVLRQFPASAEAHFGRGRSLAAAGRYAEAEAEIRQALSLAASPTPYLGELARLLIQAGRRQDGLAVVAQLRTSGKHLSNPSQGFVSAALGDRDDAFSKLMAATSDGSSNLLWARVDPRLDPLRDDPRFALLLTQLGLTR